MCARMRVGNEERQPGDWLRIFDVDGNPVNARWGIDRGGPRPVPFARNETLDSKWGQYGQTEIAIDGFAERNSSGDLVWLNKPSVMTIITDDAGNGIAVVTRAANDVEQKFFGHKRVPVRRAPERV